MQEEKLSFGLNNPNVKKDEYKKRKTKRKFSMLSDETSLDVTSGTPKLLKLALFSEKTKMFDDTKILYYKNTQDYTKIGAKPGSLPNTPKIFKVNKPINVVPVISDTFLSNFLSIKSFNTDVNGRFSQKIIDNHKKIENKKEDNLKNFKEVKEEKVVEEKVKNLIKNKKNKKIKNTKKQQQSELVKDFKIKGSEGYNGLNKEYENKSYVDIYKVCEKKALIFHMHYPSKFSFHGEIKITIIRGEIEVLGCTLNSTFNRNSADIFSPNFCTPLIVETKPFLQNSPTENLQTRLKDFLTESDYNTLLMKLKPKDSILFVEEITSDFGIVINKYFDKPLFPKDLEDVSSISESMKSLQSTFTFNPSHKEKYFRKSPQWDKIPLGQCTVLCGGKGVGKSTLLKYYINKLITLGEKVLCLDFDPGQPEFTFPGCVSAVIIDQPLLGPNFTHILDPIIMMTFGDVDVSLNPSKYLECVKYVIKSCRRNEELLKMKWFVNTMGFCKGLGVNLMITIIKLLNPNTVIQIKGSDSKNNYPFYLTSTTLNSKNGFISIPLNDVCLSYDLRVVHTCAEQKKKQLQGGLKRRQLRDIMSISYFSKFVSPPFFNFNAIQPYLISFSKLYLGIDFLINPNDVLKAFNGNVVSLSHFEPNNEEIFSVESEEDEYFKIVVKPSVAPSFGIGFVRGIDFKEKKFYLITHLSIEILDNVNCLSLGRISPPHSMFLKQETVDGRTFYTTPGTVVKIHRVKRMFRVPGTPRRKEKYSF